MKTALADQQTRAMCLRIEPVAGAAIRLTHHPRDLTMSNGETYLAGSGFQFTSVAAAANLAPGMQDIEGIVDQAGLDRAKVASGFLDNARAFLFATSWAAPVEDEEPIAASIVGRSEILDDRIRVEEMSLVDALNQQVGDTYLAQCPKTFGSTSFAGCKKDLAALTVSGTVTAVANALKFRDSALAQAAGYFNGGTVVFTSGANAGQPAHQVSLFQSGGWVSLYETFYYAIAPGDEFEIIPGCAKTLEACKAWNNVVNFGGFSNMPTSSTYLRGGL